MKILIVANNLSQGGIQTSLLNLLREISKDNKYEIELFLFSGNKHKVKEIPKNVKVITGNYLLQLTGVSLKEILSSKNVINSFIRILLMILVRIIKPKKYFDLVFRFNKNRTKYDYAISYFNDIPNTYFNKGATYYVLKWVNAKKKVGWIHTDIKQANFNIDYYKTEYKDFDYIINVSKHCKEVYDQLIPEQSNKTYVIYNFFSIDDIVKKSLAGQTVIQKDRNYENFITVARIDNISKRIDRIVDIVEILNKKNVNGFKWYIIGDGPDYKFIKEKIKDKNLEDYIILLGSIQNPYPYIKDSSVFILTSDFEGFPMVIGESLILGTPVISTNYNSAQEIIKNGYNGIILEKNVEKFSKVLEEILNNRDTIKNMKNNIQKDPLTNVIAKKQFDEIFGEANG